MAKSSTEIKETIAELENGFSTLREKAKERYNQLHVEASYENALVANLHESITTRIPYASRLPSHDAWATQGILRQDLSFHVEPGSGTKDKDEGRADKLELFYAHQWLRFNEGGKLLEATRRHQTVSPFAAWWFEYDAFALPTEASKRDDYRKSYEPFKLMIVDPLSVSFMADDNGQPTAGARFFDLPYIEIAERYGKKGRSENALVILREQFPMLRGGQGREPEQQDLYSKKAKVWVLDDGDTICHAIDLKSGRNGPQYHQISDSYPNPFGCPSLIIVPGRYNPEGIGLHQQYEPLLIDEMNAQRKVDVSMSHVASLAMTPNKHGQVIPRDVAAAAIQEDKTIPAPNFNQGIPTLYGDLAELNTGLDINSAKEVLMHAKEERDLMRPAPYLTNPDEATMRNSTASAQLNAFESTNKPYDSPRESLVAGMSRVCEMMKYFIRDGHMNKKGQPKEHNEKVYFTLSGKESASKYVGDRRGEEIEIGPDDFDDGDTLEITPVASSQSQKALAFELAHQQAMLNYKTKAQVIETQTEDVSGQIEKLNEETIYQFNLPMYMRMANLSAVEIIRLKDGIDLSFMLQASGLFPSAGQPTQPQQQQNGNTPGGYRVDPPATSVPDAGVTTV